MVWDLGGGFEALIQPVSRFTTRGHVCKHCMYYKNYNSLGDFVPYLLLFFHVRPANQTIADVALWYKKVITDTGSKSFVKSQNCTFGR